MKRLSQQSTEAVKKKPPDQHSQHRQRHHQAAAMEVDQPPCQQDEDKPRTTGTCRTVPVSRVGSATQRNPGSPRVGLTNRDVGCAATVTVSQFGPRIPAGQRAELVSIGPADSVREALCGSDEPPGRPLGPIGNPTTRAGSPAQHTREIVTIIGPC